MKGKIFLLTFGLVTLLALQAGASVFSGSGGGSLQSVFNSLGYQHIDVANYQTNLNFRLQGMMEFQLLSRSGAADLSFGVLESRHRWWGNNYRHHNVFDASDGAGATAVFAADRDNSTYGFYVSKRSGWRRTRYYSHSPFNWGGAVQALFYQDPMNSNTYLLAWSGLYTGSSHADKSYDDLVVRMTVHPAPEPATWVLLASGLFGLAIFFRVRRRQDEMG